jgi:hypothetical protein
MTSSYVAFDPDMLHSPFPRREFKPDGRDKSGVHRVFQQPRYLPVHSLSAADAAHQLVAHPVGFSDRLPTQIPVLISPDGYPGIDNGGRRSGIIGNA